MKTYKREVDGFKMTVWNDSNADWVIQDHERTSHYDKRKFTMKKALALHAQLYRPTSNEREQTLC